MYVPIMIVLVCVTPPTPTDKLNLLIYRGKVRFFSVLLVKTTKHKLLRKYKTLIKSSEYKLLYSSDINCNE